MGRGTTTEAVLTLRDRRSDSSESTALGDTVEVVRPPGFKLAAGHFVIFVHGYNVRRGAATSSYSEFRDHLEYCGARAKVLELHWPGDRNWGVISGACYPLKILTAKAAGAKLAEWIEGCPADARFTLIAHSLGCRLVLEAIDALRRSSGMTRITSVCLMAAAVPAKYIRSDRLGPRPGEDTHWHILYSRGDHVLRWLFPIGELDTPFRYAVGLYGEPLENWRSASAGGSELYHGYHGESESDFYDHGDYWGRKERPMPARSAEYLASLLGGQRMRELPCNRYPPRRSLPERFLYAL